MIKAILLAAGKSKRLKGENKLIKKFKNKALINHSLSSLYKSKVDRIVIVLGYQNKEVRKVIKKNNCVNPPVITVKHYLKKEWDKKQRKRKKRKND